MPRRPKETSRRVRRSSAERDLIQTLMNYKAQAHAVRVVVDHEQNPQVGRPAQRLGRDSARRREEGGCRRVVVIQRGAHGGNRWGTPSTAMRSMSRSKKSQMCRNEVFGF